MSVTVARPANLWSWNSTSKLLKTPASPTSETNNFFLRNQFVFAINEGAGTHLLLEIVLSPHNIIWIISLRHGDLGSLHKFIAYKKPFSSPSRQLVFYLLCISIAVKVCVLATTPTEARAPARAQNSARSPQWCGQAAAIFLLAQIFSKYHPVFVTVTR